MVVLVHDEERLAALVRDSNIANQLFGTDIESVVVAAAGAVDVAAGAVDVVAGAAVAVAVAVVVVGCDGMYSIMLDGDIQDENIAQLAVHSADTEWKDSYEVDTMACSTIGTADILVV